MKKISLLVFTFALVFGSLVEAAPWSLLSDVSYTQKGSVNAIKVDFTIPVHYVAHFPARRGKELSIILRFDKNEVKDLSQLPLLESVNAPQVENSPVYEVTYMTDRHQRPKLVIRFKHEVNFNVSQVMGIKSLVIFMPDEVLDRDVATSSPLEQALEKFKEDIPAPAQGSAKVDVEKLKVRFREGRRALRKHQYKKAIRVFSAILSQAENSLTRASMELLGVARERNNQVAHAKAVYQRYLKKYPAGDESVRVKQRLAELISEQMKPRAKLKESRSKLVKRKDSSRVIATLSQYLDYRDISLERSKREVGHTGLDNQLNVNWRVRKGDWDIRNNFSGNYEYEMVEGETDGGEIHRMYSRIRNSNKGLYLTIGRQTSSELTVGRFDGLYFGYRVSQKLRANMIYGYPVDITDKGTVQTNKPLLGMNLEISDVIKGWEFSPFFIDEKDGPLTDRRAIGTGVSYFGKGQGRFYSLLDYDAFKPTSINLYMEYKRTPQMYRVSNALIGEDETLEEAVNQGIDETRLRDAARDRTGRSRIITLGVSHDFSPRLHLAVDISRSDSLSKYPQSLDATLAGRLVDPAATSKYKQVDVSTRVILDEWLRPKDTLILGLHHSHTTDSDLISYSTSYRFFYQGLYRVEPKFIYKNRRNSNSSRVIKRIPAMKIEYRARQDLRYYMEFNLDITTSSVPGNSYRGVNYYVGYSWDFL